MTHHQIHTILVPTGAEYKAVCQGLSRVKLPAPRVYPIPVGCNALTGYLETWLQAGHLPVQQSGVLLMGLCGSLTPALGVGDVVLYRNCVTPSMVGSAHPTNDLTALLYHHLQEKVSLVTGLTSERVISSAEEKRHLGEMYNAQVVDMEGFAALEILIGAGVAVAMLRVVSDGCDRNIPDLTSAITPDGLIKPLPLAIKMLRQPIAASRLVRGSLRGLQVLREVTTSLLSE
jgi:hypothetical protein